MLESVWKGRQQVKDFHDRVANTVLLFFKIMTILTIIGIVGVILVLTLMKLEYLP